MYNSETLQLFGQWAIPVISIGITYGFSIFKESRNRTRKNLENRYKKAYLPYLTNLYKLYAFNSLGDRLINTSSTRLIFLDLLTNNLQYWGTKTVALYPKFYKAFLDMLEYDKGNKEFANAPIDMFSISNEITLSILEEAEYIESKLGYTKLSHSFLKNYRYNKNAHIELISFE